MDWYVIHTKVRQESRALENLSAQGYECYLPQIKRQKIRRGAIELALEPLFPRYLFIRLDTSHAGKSWGPIRSTLGVSGLVSFGGTPAKAPDLFVDNLKQIIAEMLTSPQKIYQPGDRLLITSGPFAGIEGIFQMDDGASRAMLLIEILNKATQIKVPVASLSKVS
jgi:transcriptional antiterminator RfaH